MTDLIEPYFSTPVFVMLFAITLIIGISLGWYLRKAYCAFHAPRPLGIQPVIFVK